jgi:hypothetical protein
VFRYWVTPERGGPQTLPSIAVPYFDPEEGEYLYARSKPVPFLVRGDPSEAASVEDGKLRGSAIDRDIRLIRAREQIDSRLLPNLYRSWWFWILVLTPPLSFVVTVIADRVSRRLRKETPRARLRRARGNARKRFRLAEIHLRGNRPSKFFGELARVVYEHLEERLSRPLQSLTREDLAATLTSAGFAKSTVERIARELDACDFARFSPSGASREEMEKALGRVRELLRDIERTRLAIDGDEVVAA